LVLSYHLIYNESTEKVKSAQTIAGCQDTCFEIDCIPPNQSLLRSFGGEAEISVSLFNLKDVKKHVHDECFLGSCIDLGQVIAMRFL
jgi:hypothetical protein